MLTDLSKSASALAKYSQCPCLRLTRKSSTGSRLVVHDVHLQSVAELAGIAEKHFELARARVDALLVRRP